AAVALNDAPDVGEADAGALEVRAAVQALKDAKQFLGIFHVEAHAVVADEDNRLSLRLEGADLDAGLGAGPGVFEGVGQQVDEDQPQQRRVAANIWQRPDHPLNLASLE